MWRRNSRELQNKAVQDSSPVHSKIETQEKDRGKKDAKQGCTRFTPGPGTQEVTKIETQEKDREKERRKTNQISSKNLSPQDHLT